MVSQSVKELLYDAVYYDESFLAHAIYFAVQKGFVHLEDPESKIPYEQLDYTAILKMRDENQLKMCGVKFYIIPMASKKFALYLAERDDEARAEHRRIYGEVARNVLDMSDKMDTSTYCEETKKWQSFRELKREVVEFPYYAGEIWGRGARL
ncbi:hypothetical protein [Sporosarcina pasteurii]|uniref:Uncharacterized protein n=1 Tax=Sporosarcina pasteurii TaxID=1474 RepID=A0A380C2N7_SPOPA|nr:hypothetical protein [Sporosarcina pasteurii]MDS9471518.1 hypothetical protein [Sporosarcina pasteurii]QBQ04862.1 hypothetical protein E2C16_03890 [Sporosarcina pasteurii]SUJ10635.1 Uncharacterised protein [Sporosarcina pasteurii]